MIDSRGPAPFAAGSVLSFVQRLEKLDWDVEIHRSFQSFIEKIGFSSVTCASLPRSGPLDPSHILMTTRPASFLQICFERRYPDFCPVLRELSHLRRPLAWSDITTGRVLTRKEKEIFRHRAEFGMHEGFFVPVNESNGDLGIVNFAGPAIELTEDKRGALILVSSYVYQRLCGLRHGVAEAKQELTRRETEILGWIAVGKSDWQIGQILGISSKTVNYHIENVKRKFGVATRVQAVVIALQRGNCGISGSRPAVGRRGTRKSGAEVEDALHISAGA